MTAVTAAPAGPATSGADLAAYIEALEADVRTRRLGNHEGLDEALGRLFKTAREAAEPDMSLLMLMSRLTSEDRACLRSSRLMPLLASSQDSPVWAAVGTAMDRITKCSREAALLTLYGLRTEGLGLAHGKGLPVLAHSGDMPVAGAWAPPAAPPGPVHGLWSGFAAAGALGTLASGIPEPCGHASGLAGLADALTAEHEVRRQLETLYHLRGCLDTSILLAVINQPETGLAQHGHIKAMADLPTAARSLRDGVLAVLDAGCLPDGMGWAEAFQSWFWHYGTDFPHYDKSSSVAPRPRKSRAETQQFLAGRRTETGLVAEQIADLERELGDEAATQFRRCFRFR